MGSYLFSTGTNIPSQDFDNWNYAIEQSLTVDASGKHRYIYINRNQVAVFSKAEFKAHQDEGYHRLSVLQVAASISDVYHQCEKSGQTNQKISQQTKEAFASMVQKHQEHLQEKYGWLTFVAELFQRIYHGCRLKGFFTTAELVKQYADLPAQTATDAPPQPKTLPSGQASPSEDPSHLPAAAISPQPAAVTPQREPIPAIPYSVGRLGAEWKFPTDHLPIGISVDGLHFADWNVLNKNYLHHIHRDGQGLNGSAITTKNIPDPRGATIREYETIANALAMMNHPVYPRSVMVLHEVHQDVATSLQAQMPSKYAAYNDFRVGGENMICYDTDVFDVVSIKTNRYPNVSNKAIMVLLLEEKSTKRKYRFIVSHVPGGPHSDVASQQLAKIAIRQYRPDSTDCTVIMGDMNRAPEVFLQNFRDEAATKGQAQPYESVQIPYPTHVNTRKEASWVDNIFVATQLQVQVAQCTDFFDGVEDAVDLLESKR